MILRTDLINSGLNPDKEPVTAIGFVVPSARVAGPLARELAPAASTGAPRQLSSKSKRSFGSPSIAFQSKPMNELIKLANRFAQSSASVMITGESGTGKELFSRLIHDKSHRGDQKFVAVNCAAIPEALIESEIFGHERGAFTGALQKRTGYFERAHQGTLLLDEVSEIPIQLQAKLLRVIEEKEVQPVGSDAPRSVDVRIVATSNRDLKQEVEAGRFRRDLYHRLNVLELRIPPLRDRISDIPLLVMHFLEMFQNECTQKIERVSKEAMQVLCEHPWYGNVRELRNVIHRACVVSINGEISADCIPAIPPAKPETQSFTFSGLPLAEVERQMIISCLQHYRGNKKSAAKVLGVTPRTLSNKLKQYQEEGLTCPSFH